MSPEEGTRRAPESGRARRDPDPLQMTEIEKRMAEWEARHDVAARGRRVSAPDVVQHYCAHERLNEVSHARPAGAHASGARQGPRPAGQPPGRLRYLFSRLF